MKKLSIVLTLLLVAALAFGGVALAEETSAAAVSGEVANLLNQIDTLTHECEVMREAFYSATVDANNMREKLTAAEKKTDDVKADLEGKLAAAAEEAAGVKADLEGKLKAAADEAAAMKADYEGKLKAAADEAAAVKADLEGKLKATADEAAAMKADLEGKLKAATDEAAAVKADLEGKLKTAADEAAAAKTDFEGKLKAAADQAAAVKADLEGKLKAAADEAAAAKTDFEGKLKTAADQAAAVKTDLEGKLKTAADEAAAVKTDFEGKLKAAADQAAAVKADLEGKLKTAADEAAAVKTDFEGRLKTAADEAAAVKTDFEGKLKTAASDAAAVKADLEAKLKTAADQAAAVKADLESKVTALTEESGAAQEALKAAEEAAAAVDEQIKTLTGERDTAQKALDSANNTVANLEAQVSAFANLIKSDLNGCTVILHSNDVHGALEGYAYMATLRDWYEAKGAKVILADAGDFSQGTIYVSTNKGEAAIDMMNSVGYDVVTLGNHEFDFGYAKLMENLSKAEFTTVCCNVILDETGEAILPNAAVCEIDGVKIAFVGVETPETATKVNPGMIKEIHFTAFDELYTTVQAAVDNVRNEADIVIGLCHLGVDAESAANGYRSIDLLNHVTGIDFVIDGHSHTVMTEGENGEPIQSTGTKFENVGVIVIDNAEKKIVDNYLYPTAGLPKNEAVLGLAQAIIADVDAVYGSPFAVSEVELNGAKAPGNRTEETNLGDLITDAMVWSVTREGGLEQVEPNQVVGITNGGGIRAAVKPGDVSMKDINTVLPFGNTVAVIYVTGDELLEALEASTFCTPDAVGGYPQTSGITWTLDTTKEFAKGDVYVLDGKESSYFKPASIQRVTIEAINGEAFDPAATYAVVTNNFCAAGGDTYNVFARAYNEGTGFDTGIPMDQAVMEYITDVLEGKITEAAYGAPRGTETQIK